MATKSITSLGLGNADLTAIGKLSETGLSQVEIADAVVEGNKLKKGNIPAGQVGAYTKAQVDILISAIPETDLSNYYNKTEVYNKLESYSKVEVDGLIAGGGADLSDYYTKAQVDSLIDAIPETDLTNYYNKTEVYNKLETYNKTEVDNLIPDISTKQDTLVSATNIKTINGQSVLGSGDLVISGGGAVDLSEYYKKTETYSKVEVDTKIADIPPTDLSGYYNKTQVDSLIDAIPATDLSNYYDKTETYSKVEVDTKIADIPPTNLSGYYNKTETETLLSNKQDNLVSGTNIKTINGQSVLGNGNMVITAESASPLNVPVITSPTNGAVDYIGSITSTYTTSQSYVGVQDWVRWEAGTDENFTNIIDSYEGSDNLTNWTPAIGGLDITTIYVRTKQGSDNHLSSWSDTISFTTPDIYVENPTITVEGTPNDVLKNPTISGSAFSVYGGTDTHESTDYQVVRVSDGVVVWESLGNTTNKTSIKTGDLVESTAYIFKMRYNSESYGSSNWVETTGTTKAVFNIPIGVQGKKGFGVAPTDLPFAVLGLAEMTGTNDPESDNYGNYIHTNGSIVCWCPKGYYRVGSSESPRFATYGANALDIVGIETFSTTVEANTAGYALHRAFINAGAEQSGFFIDKYMNSKDGTTASKSVFGGVPISLATTAGYTVSNGMTGCTGILADAVVLSKARGTRWNTATAFMYGYLAMVSVAQAQSATSTGDVAWYDPTGVTNFPKGCNNNALSDINDTSVVYVTAGDSGNANKPKTGATVGFTKTTHNGSSNGVADLNGGMWEVTIGITNFGTSATDTASITTDQIYVLKQSVDVATLTGGWDTTNDVWGNTTNLATKYDLVTSPHPLGSATGTVYWGNGANAVLQNDLSGVNRDVCGFIPKNASSTSATGSNLFGNDYLNKNNKGNLVPITCGAWTTSALAGVFARYFGYGRSGGDTSASFRASAYVAL